MNCKYVLNNLHEYIYGELDNISSTAIKEHLLTCHKCHAEYDNLKKILTDDIKEITLTKSSIIPPQNLSKKIHRKLKKHNNFTSRYIAVASLIFMFLILAPSVTAYLRNYNSLDKYKIVAKEIVQKLNDGKGEIINESYTINDIKFTVDAIIKEENTIGILYSVKLLKPENANFAMPTKIHIKDQFGFNGTVYEGIASIENEFKDNETKGVCYLKKPSIFSNKLKLRVTCFNLDMFNKPSANNTKYKETNNIYGNWHVEFAIP